MRETRSPSMTSTFKELEKDVIPIGSLPENEICLRSPFVSRRHAQLLRKDDGYLLVDRDSTNGTYLNGNKIEAGLHHTLSNGGEVRIDEFRLGYLEIVGDTPTRRSTPAVRGSLHADRDALDLWINGKRVSPRLPNEIFQLTCLLVENRRKVLSHVEVGEAIWGSEVVGGSRVLQYDRNMIYQLVSRLKRILREQPGSDSLIRNVPRRG